jgi:hypothetical protein
MSDTLRGYGCPVSADRREPPVTGPDDDVIDEVEADDAYAPTPEPANSMPLEAEPADVVEQSVEVPQDDEDYPEG